MKKDLWSGPKWSPVYIQGNWAWFLLEFSYYWGQAYNCDCMCGVCILSICRYGVELCSNSCHKVILHLYMLSLFLDESQFHSHSLWQCPLNVICEMGWCGNTCLHVWIYYFQIKKEKDFSFRFSDILADKGLVYDNARWGMDKYHDWMSMSFNKYWNKTRKNIFREEYEF